MVAGQLEVGSMVKMADGEFEEVIDLQPARLGAAVAIFFEEREEPLVVRTGLPVVVK